MDLVSKLNGYSQIICFGSWFINMPYNLQKDLYAAISLLGLNCNWATRHTTQILKDVAMTFFKVKNV